MAWHKDQSSRFLGQISGQQHLQPNAHLDEPSVRLPQISRQSPLAIAWAGGDPEHELVMINRTMSVQSLFPAPGLDAGYFVWLDANTINVSFTF